ncbi:MAG: MBL fold metallo-hydrolase, partial [Lachnospiraceae bacterium]|nr:MBL fold metallo-hydrolase [Lachnospiraceae bacterium]
MELCSIASGSSGNCIYVGSDNTHLIVDAGISGKRIEAGLNGIGLKTSEMDGLLITHEHSDHIASVGVLARKYGLPMYATRGTIEGILQSKYIGEIPEGLFREIRADEPFMIEDLCIHPVSV